MDLGGFELALIALAACAGGVAQSTLGFGASFTTVPALAVIAPELLPAAMIVAIVPLSVVMVLRSRAELDVRGLGRLTIGRLPGIAAGGWVVATLPTGGLTIGIAVLLLGAVAAAAVGWQVTVRPGTEIVAGALSGLTGTAGGLGGPPLAVLYRGRAGAVMRPTLAGVWAVGAVPALTSLAVAGELVAAQVRAGGLLAVAMLTGLLVAEPIVRRVPDATIRRAVLGWAAIGGLLALVRTLL